MRAIMVITWAIWNLFIPMRIFIRRLFLCITKQWTFLHCQNEKSPRIDEKRLFLRVNTFNCENYVTRYVGDLIENIASVYSLANIKRLNRMYLVWSTLNWWLLSHFKDCQVLKKGQHLRYKDIVKITISSAANYITRRVLWHPSTFILSQKCTIECSV